MFSHLKSSQYENRKDDKHTAETSHLYFCVFVSRTPHPSHHHRQGPCACMCVCEWLTWVPSSLHPSLHPSAASFGGSEQVPWGWCTLLYVCVAATLFSPLTFCGLRKKKNCLYQRDGLRATSCMAGKIITSGSTFIKIWPHFVCSSLMIYQIIIIILSDSD